ncbi:MAG: hypothetical protein ACM309_00740 [Bacillota bacterium]
MPKSFKIAKSVSGKSWGDVDKSRIWQLLKRGLEEAATGVAEAIREVYAVIKAEVNKDLTQADCWGPHHEVRDDGTVVLNRAGLIVAAAALAGGRSEPDLTAEEKEKARKHLLRHYRELDMPAPESLAGEMVSVTARICGEMSVEQVPVSSAVDVEALRAGDDDPLELVVEIPAGKSKRGWDYLPRALQDIVDVVNAEGLPGHEGHQDLENVDWEFRTPVTHWVGALWRDGKAYFRGVVDKAASDLKRWIRGGIIKTVSIWGIPKLAYENGETKVIGYEPLSIDWTPPRRAGMPTRIVAVGEMDTIGEIDGSLESLMEDLRVAAAQKLGVDVSAGQWVYIERTFENYVVVSVGGPRTERKLYKLDYAVDGDKVVVGDPVEVQVKHIYEPVTSGEMRNAGGVQKAMTWKELVAQLKAMLASGDVTRAQVAGEMGWKAQEIAGEIDPKWLKDVMGAAETLGKVREALGVTGEMDVVKVAQEGATTIRKVREALKVSGEMDVVKAAEEAAKAVEAQKAAEHDRAVGEMLATKLTSEAVKKDISSPETQIGKLWAYHKSRIQRGATKEQIAGEIDAFLGDKVVKAVIDAYHTDKPAIIGGTSETKTTLRVKREQI